MADYVSERHYEPYIRRMLGEVDTDCLEQEENKEIEQDEDEGIRDDSTIEVLALST